MNQGIRGASDATQTHCLSSRVETMSDVFEGPGWWMASDGKWYPPQDHPDDQYRSRFLPQVLAAQPGQAPEQLNSESAVTDALHNQSIAGAVAGGGGAPDVGDLAGGGTNLLDRTTEDASFVDAPFVEAGAVAPTAAVPEVPEVAAAIPEVTIPEVSIPGPEVAAAIPEATIPTATYSPVVENPNAANGLHTEPPPQTDLTAEAATVRVSKDEIFAPAPEIQRPTFPPRIPTSVSENPDVQIELGREDSPTKPNSLLSAGSTTTDVVVVEGGPVESGVPVRDRITATLIFLSGIAMIVGTFLTWIPGDIPESGWDRGEGIATVIAGIAGSAAAGSIFVGFRHAIPKAAAIIGGLVGLVVIGLVAISSMDGGAGRLGIGLIIVGAAAAAMLLAGIVQPSHDDNW